MKSRLIADTGTVVHLTVHQHFAGAFSYLKGNTAHMICDLKGTDLQKYSTLVNGHEFAFSIVFSSIPLKGYIS